MPELREVFEMTTKQVEPDHDSWRQQKERQHGARRNRRRGALVVGLALGIVVVTAVIQIVEDRTGAQPATRPGNGPEPAQTDRPPVGAVGPVPETDYVLNLDTGETTPLPESIASDGRGSNGYAASPDGSRLAYTERGDNGKSQIFVANLDGTGVGQVTHDAEGASSPVWSPDGSGIAYIVQHGDDLRDLFMLDLATNLSTQLTFGTWKPDPAAPEYGPWRAGEPSFTPDGSSIVYSATRGDAGGDQGEAEIRMVPVAGGESVTLAQGLDMARLSPDGTLVAFSSAANPGGSCPGAPPAALCVANVDGTGFRVLVQGGLDAIGMCCWVARRIADRVQRVPSVRRVDRGRHHRPGVVRG